jgi:meiotically up-regulated gene 157 (Mug157) protein
LNRLRRSIAVVGLLATVALSAPAAAPNRAATLREIYAHAVDEAYSRHTAVESDGTTFVSTGDIEQEWLRDSSAVLMAYVETARHDPYVETMLRGAIVRQARYIQVDPYANAFTLDYKVAERKFEVDSLLYPIWFASHYWKATGDRSIFTGELQRMFARVLVVLRTEQHHDTRSKYRSVALLGGTNGTPVAYTGMIWTGFRPSDDPAQYQYNIPENMLAVVVLRDLTRIERKVYRDNRMAMEAWGLSEQVELAVERYGTAFVPGDGRIYAYEVDGFGHANLMDDANVPSLLSIPYFGYVPATDSTYRQTRRFVLSDKNPFFYAGTYAQGVGSPHTPRGYVWPLALVVQALTSTDSAETDRVMGYIAQSDTGNHVLHESFYVDDPHKFTRADFAWPNALFAELMRRRAQSRSPVAAVFSRPVHSK